MSDRYVGSDRHKRPWLVGESGSQCGDADGVALFKSAVPHPHNPRQRFVTDGERWYRALPDDNPGQDGGMVWHGHPVEPLDVPAAVQRVFVARQVLRRVHLKKVVPWAT